MNDRMSESRKREGDEEYTHASIKLKSWRRRGP